MSETVKITTVGEFDAEELWSAVFGSAWETWDWWWSIKYIDCNWDVVGKVKIVACDPDDEDAPKVTKTIGLDDIVKAIESLTARDYFTVARDLKELDFDACSGDCVIQEAIFGEVIYG